MSGFSCHRHHLSKKKLLLTCPPVLADGLTLLGSQERRELGEPRSSSKTNVSALFHHLPRISSIKSSIGLCKYFAAVVHQAARGDNIVTFIYWCGNDIPGVRGQSLSIKTSKNWIVMIKSKELERIHSVGVLV